MKRIIVTASVGIAAASFCLSGCGLTGGSDLQASCTSFTKMSSARQMHLASEWANPVRDGKTSTISDAAAYGERNDLLNYCEQSGHGHDHLANLDYKFG